MLGIRIFLQKILILLQVTLSVVVGKTLMILFPNAVKRYILKMGEKSRMNQNPKFSYENWGPTFFSFKYLQFVLKVKWKRLEDEAFEGHPAPNTPVVTLGGELCHILDFMKDDRPLILNFGSYFSSIADFLIIYIEEAHAVDGWAFKNNVIIKNHRSLEDRKTAAQFLEKNHPLCPVVLDTMENLTSSKYAALPERLYMLQGGKVIYKSWSRGMSYCLHSESHLDTGPIYVRENGKLHVVNRGAGGVQNVTPKARPFSLFSRSFSVELCMNREDDRARRQRTDHFIFTYTKEGNLRYSAKSLFSLVLGYISDNVDHIDSLIGFPEQIAEKLFSAAEARQKFTEPVTGLRALQKFTEAYGSLVLCSLCLRNRYLVISEKLEEIKSFRELTCLDLSCCKLGDEHELLEHLTKEALSSVKRLLLKDNSLSDAGLRRMTAPVRVLKKGLENLLVLDLSCNPKITDVGIGYLLSFKKLNCLDISGTGLKDVDAVIKRLQMQIGLVHSKVPLKEFDHSNCKTEGWAEQTVLQWEQAVMEAMKPQDNLRSRVATLRFCM
ncbi:hypothetical protein HGM15179_007052 [Zosterops borbonicus]|uniref:Leucine-rich repeat-containing protein 42 n=1 Tax=Zosterops borbonicus TaxID=364589 RepID=A0A8K1LNG3_9PASS|nr:hypothetical protein HGM15179_007052 [Zosterops borbonicus]